MNTNNFQILLVRRDCDMVEYEALGNTFHGALVELWGAYVESCEEAIAEGAKLTHTVEDIPTDLCAFLDWIVNEVGYNIRMGQPEEC